MCEVPKRPASSWRTAARHIAVVMAATAAIVSGCREAPAWWCIDALECYPTREGCEELTRSVEANCTEQPVAFCKMGCERFASEAYVELDCRERCSADEGWCEEQQDLDAPCEPMLPPASPHLFPVKSWPGWWCVEIDGPEGITHPCFKARQQCQATRALVLQSMPALAGPCERSRSATCFEYLDGEVTQTSCYETADSCARSREALLANRPVEVTQCGPWVHGAESRRRRAPRPELADGPRLVFRFSGLATDQLRTSRIVRSRLGHRALEPPSLALRGDSLVVAVPGYQGDLALLARIAWLLTAEGEWSIHRARTGQSELGPPLLDCSSTKWARLGFAGARDDLEPVARLTLENGAARRLEPALQRASGARVVLVVTHPGGRRERLGLLSLGELLGDEVTLVPEPGAEPGAEMEADRHIEAVVATLQGMCGTGLELARVRFP